MSIIEGYQKYTSVYVTDWFERYEQELKKCDAVSIRSVYPYIFFKLAHDFAFSRGNSIDIHDPLAINYFMGSLCYNQVMKDFQRSAIVMQTQTERMYFGSPSISYKRMRNSDRKKEKSVDDFGTFITYLEEKVFQEHLSNFDERQKETLGMILRIINQGVGAVAMKMFNAYLQVRSGESDEFSSDGLRAIRYLMRPDVSYKKGSSQIDIVYDDDGKIQLYRREYLKVQKLDMESLVDPESAKDERWCLVMFLSRDATGESSDWRLHFSVSNIPDDCESTTISSSARSLTKARHLGRVSSDLRLCRSDLSTSSGGSAMSIDRWNSVGISDNKKSGVRRTRSRRRRPIRDLLHRRKVKQSSKLVYNSLDWLKQFQENSDEKRTRDFQGLHPYIDFKLSHDLSLSHDRCIEFQDWVAINYFLGSFCYSQARERFNQNTIVLTTETEKLYFGSSAPPDDDRSVHEDDSYNGDFVAFITCLEKKVFKRSFRKINNCQKRTLGVILRFLCQNINAVVSKLFKSCVLPGLTAGDREQETIQVQGLSRIGIESKGDNIYLSKEQNLTLRKSEKVSKWKLAEDITESWKMVTNIMQVSTTNYPNWNLHFSVVQNSSQDQDRLTLTSSDSSQNSLSFCYPGTNSHNCSTSCASSKTGIYGNNQERSSPDCISMNIDEVKKSEPAILPRREREALPDELRNRIDSEAQTAPTSVLTDVDDIPRFRLSEIKINHFRPPCGDWIVKDNLGI